MSIRTRQILGADIYSCFPPTGLGTIFMLDPVPLHIAVAWFKRLDAIRGAIIWQVGPTSNAGAATSVTTEGEAARVLVRDELSLIFDPSDPSTFATPIMRWVMPATTVSTPLATVSVLSGTIDLFLSGTQTPENDGTLDDFFVRPSIFVNLTLVNHLLYLGLGDAEMAVLSDYTNPDQTKFSGTGNLADPGDARRSIAPANYRFATVTTTDYGAPLPPDPNPLCTGAATVTLTAISYLAYNGLYDTATGQPLDGQDVHSLLPAP